MLAHGVNAIQELIKRTVSMCVKNIYSSLALSFSETDHFISTAERHQYTV